MDTRRAKYIIPVVVAAANGVLATLCILYGLQHLSKNFPGFFFYPNGAVTSMQRMGWEGLASGIRPGDVVLAADGVQIHDGRSLKAFLTTKRQGDVVTFSFRRPNAPSLFQVALKLRSLTTTDVLASFALPISIGVIYFFLGIFVFFLKRSYEAALAMSVCVVASVFYLTIFDAHTTFKLTQLWVCYPLLGAVSFHLFTVFPAHNRRLHRWPFIALSYCGACATLLFSEIHLYDARYGTLSSLLSSTYLSISFLADIFLLTTTVRHHPSETIQNKANTVRIGLLLTTALGLIWTFLARHYPELITAERAMMLSSLFPILLAYAIVKKNLFDVDVFLRTTAIHTIATLTALLLYFVVVFILGVGMSAWTRRYVGPFQHVESIVISTLLVAVIFKPLHLAVQRVIDRFFFRSKSLLQNSLIRLGQDLGGMTSDLSALAQHLTSQVERLMRCRYVMLLLQEHASAPFRLAATSGTPPSGLDAIELRPEMRMVQMSFHKNAPVSLDEPELGQADPEMHSILKSAEISKIVPIQSQTQPIGFLLLGPRHYGDAYRRFDLDALRGLVFSVALVLENALLLKRYAERERFATLGKFAAVIIHEIKNPLGIIRVSSGTLKKRFSKEDSGHELASFIEEEVIRMNQTIAQFLAFSRPHPPQKEKFDLALLLTRISGAARDELEGFGVELHTAIEGPIWVHADPNQIKQVLLNLLVNARQALQDKKDARVELCARRLHKKSYADRVEVVISDNGPGIDPAILPRIFEPFFTTRSGGSGLGLAIAKQLLKEQGGTIEVRTQAIGVQFIISLSSADAYSGGHLG